MFSQGMDDRSKYYDYGKRFFTDAYIFNTQSPDSIKIAVYYRFSNSLLSFIKNESLYNNNEFYSIAVCEVSYRDDKGIIRKRELNTDTIFVNNFEETKSKTLYKINSIISNLLVSNYDINIELRNINNVKIQQVRIPRIVTKKSIFDNTISKPILCYKIDENGHFFPFILDSAISFSSKNSHILIEITDSIESNYKYEIEQIPISKNNELNWGEFTKLSGVINPDYGKMLNISNELRYKSTIIKTENILNGELKQKIGIIDISLPPERIIPGNFRLNLFKVNTKDTFKFNFKIEWEDMPISLRMPEYAAEMMYYILTDEEYKHINSGDNSTILGNIINFWKKKDPTRFTEYNESMAEYFKRVDYAFFNFQTLSEKDGAKTERGKIYILYGKPDSTDRTLNDGSTFEEWVYEKLKKKFIFESKSNQIFRLVKIIDM